MNCAEVKQGLRVRTNAKLGSTEGMMIAPGHMSERKPNQEGIVVAVVPGHGGDVWWVNHEKGAPIAPYSFTEFEPVEAVAPPASPNTGPLTPTELERLGELLIKIGVKGAVQWPVFAFGHEDDPFLFCPQETDIQNAEFIVWAMEQIKRLAPEITIVNWRFDSKEFIHTKHEDERFEMVKEGPNLGTALARVLIAVLEEK